MTAQASLPDLVIGIEVNDNEKRFNPPRPRRLPDSPFSLFHLRQFLDRLICIGACISGERVDL